MPTSVCMFLFSVSFLVCSKAWAQLKGFAPFYMCKVSYQYEFSDDKFWETWKTFAALFTFVRCLSRMNFLILSKDWGLGKCFVTFFTLVRFQSSLDILAFTYTRSITTGFSTFFELLGFSPLWTFLMYLKIWGTSKGLAALFKCVKVSVQNESSDVGKGVSPA